MYTFEDALRVTLQFEGGKVDDPADPGGRTAYGITQKTFDAWRLARMQLTADVWTIPSAEVAQLYKEQFWFGSGADVLAWPLSLVHFDAAVNHGVGRAAQFLKAATWADVPTQAEVFAYLTTRREHILTHSSLRFMRGLLNRIDNLLKETGL